MNPPSPSPPVVVPVYPHPVRWSPLATALFRVEAWWDCHSGKPGKTWRDRRDAILAPDLPFSLMPQHIRETLDLVEEPVPRWRGPRPDWFGAPCGLAQVRIWLPRRERPLLLVPFDLVILLPHADPPDAPAFILLGSQLLVERRARLCLDAGQTDPATPCGEIVFP